GNTGRVIGKKLHPVHRARGIRRRRAAERSWVPEPEPGAFGIMSHGQQALPGDLYRVVGLSTEFGGSFRERFDVGCREVHPPAMWTVEAADDLAKARDLPLPDGRQLIRARVVAEGLGRRLEGPTENLGIEVGGAVGVFGAQVVPTGVTDRELSVDQAAVWHDILLHAR